MDTKETELYLDFLSYAFNGGRGYGAEVTCELDYDRGRIFNISINSPGLDYEVNDTILINGNFTDAGSIKVLEVDGSGSVLNFVRLASGSGYNPGVNVETIGGNGEGLTVDIVSVMYPILSFNIIKSGKMYNGNHPSWTSPYPPFGEPRFNYNLETNDYFHPSLDININEEGGISHITLYSGGGFETPPMITVERSTVVHELNLNSFFSVWDNFDRTRLNTRLYTALSEFVQCNVTQEKYNTIINEAFLYLSQIGNPIPDNRPD